LWEQKNLQSDENFFKNDFFLQKKSFLKKFALSGRSFSARYFPNYLGKYVLGTWVIYFKMSFGNDWIKVFINSKN
jgi:hypothetical protein